MKIKSKVLGLLIAVFVVSMFVLNGCSSGGGEGKIRIGFAMDTLKEERWQKDRDYFTQRAEELGAEVIVLSADGDPLKQNQQCETLVAKGVDLLVVVPFDAKSSARCVEVAHNEGIKVMAYDRMISNCEVDLYMSFDNVRVGELQAEYMLKVVPEGRYVLVGGAQTDNNAHLFRKGQMNILQPAIDSGKIKIVADQWAENWQPIKAMEITKAALSREDNNIDAVVASNDGTAGGVIAALQEQKLDGIVAVSGQDADIAACQRVVAGIQSMTVYKPIKKIATTAAEVAVDIVKNDAIPDTGGKTINNGLIDVPSILLEPVQVDKENMYSVVIKQGFHTMEEVYKDIPKDQWPSE